jgi:hypothetical protein
MAMKPMQATIAVTRPAAPRQRDHASQQQQPKKRAPLQEAHREKQHRRGEHQAGEHPAQHAARHLQRQRHAQGGPEHGFDDEHDVAIQPTAIERVERVHPVHVQKIE